jgi:hypothetical protein
VHIALVVTGDFTALHGTAAEQTRLRNVIRRWIRAGEGRQHRRACRVASARDVPFGFAEVGDRTLFLTTRDAASALTPSPFAGALGATGNWALRARQPLFAERDARWQSADPTDRQCVARPDRRRPGALVMLWLRRK